MGDTPTQWHVHLINWETITKPKVHGGLGIRDSKTSNDAFLMTRLGGYGGTQILF